MRGEKGGESQVSPFSFATRGSRIYAKEAGGIIR